MATVTRSSFAGTTDWEPIANMTKVFEGPINATIPGWITITLDTAFYYNNTRNLLIAVDENTAGTDGVRFTGTTANSRVLHYRNNATNPDAATPPTGTIANVIGNIRIDGLTQVSKTWTGSFDSDWTNAGNWSPTGAPVATDNIFIAKAAFSPALSTIVSINNLIIDTSVQLSIANGQTLYVSGTLYNNYQVIGNGTLNLNGTNQIIKGNGLVRNLTLNNTSTSFDTTLTSFISIERELLLQNGVLTANKKLRLMSTASGTAHIAPVTGGTIVGEVIVDRCIAGGRRAFRFLGHPFATNIELAQFADDISITGAGGISNGFASNTSTSPSAFSYITSNGDGQPNDGGWSAIPNTSYTIPSGDAIRLFIRGPKGQPGEFIASTIPEDATISVIGQLNPFGNYTKTIVPGGVEGYNFVANPYASPVNLSAATPDNINNTYWVWNARGGTRGIYENRTFGGAAYLLPSMGGFFVQALSTSGSLTFHEADKTITEQTNLRQAHELINTIALSVTTPDGTLWDTYQLNFNEKATSKKDATTDGRKLSNPEVNLYSISTDNQALSIDTRPLQEEKINLGFTSNIPRSFIIHVTSLHLPAGYEAYWNDHYTNTTLKLLNEGEYTFHVNTDTKSQGDDRFSITLQKTTEVLATALPLTIYPNPATTKITVEIPQTIEQPEKLLLYSANGKLLSCIQNIENKRLVAIQLQGLATGCYFITLLSNQPSITSPFVIE